MIAKTLNIRSFVAKMRLLQFTLFFRQQMSPFYPFRGGGCRKGTMSPFFPFFYCGAPGPKYASVNINWNTCQCLFSNIRIRQNKDFKTWFQGSTYILTRANIADKYMGKLHNGRRTATTGLQCSTTTTMNTRRTGHLKKTTVMMNIAAKYFWRFGWSRLGLVLTSF